MPPPTQARLPFGPLQAFLRRSDAETARTLDIGRRTLLRWAKDGVPHASADKIAVELGVHPSQIWDEWFA